MAGYAGVTIVGCAVIYWLTKYNLSLGLLLGLVPTAVVQLAISTVRWYKSFNRYKNAYKALIDHQYSHMIDKEIHWITVMIARIRTARKIMLSLFIFSVMLLIIIIIQNLSHVAMGIWMAVCFNTIFIFFYDVFLEMRLKSYHRELMIMYGKSS